MTLEYKGYVAGPIDFDADDGTFSGTVAGLKDVLHFEGTTADELRASFQGTIEEYLKMCAERGEQPDKAYKGEILARVGPELHRKAAMKAAQKGESLSEYVAQLLETA
ncbi:MAG: HicB protein [Rhodospirillales bacterium]|jgi:predicted HicB family RNase H-like nuclease|nr:HicB protein [Rhodospirillales bacterium]